MTSTWDLELVTMGTLYSTHSKNPYCVSCEGLGSMLKTCAQVQHHYNEEQIT